MYPIKKQQVLCKNHFSFQVVAFLFAVLFIPMATFSNCHASTLFPIPNYLGALPLSFEARPGETEFQNEFLTRGLGYQLYLSAGLAVFRLSSDNSPGLNSPATSNFQQDAVLQMEIVNGNLNASAETLEPLPGKINYFTGDDPSLWRTNIPTHAKIRYREIYPGIDLDYYGHQGTLEYDFVVAPGIDPAQIRLAFSGIDSMEIATNGDLLLHTSRGILRQKAPYSYQEKSGIRQVIPSRFVYSEDFSGQDPGANKHIGFELASYDTSQPLVIDPALSYSTYFGGTSSDYASGMTTDSAGNIYLTGWTSSSNFPTLNPYQATRQGGDEGFISKISGDGSTLIYSTYLGGSGYDYPQDIAVDSAGNAYITGQTTSTNFPVTTGVVQASHGGSSYDVFVAKISAAGDVLDYATYLGGTNQDYGQGISVDSVGNAYIAGYTDSADFPAYNALYPYQSGGTNTFVSQLNPTATAFVYSTFMAASQAYDIAVDSAGNAYVTGNGWTGFPVTAGAYANAGVTSGIFVSKINTGGSSLVYSALFGGNSSDYAYGIALDSSNQVYVTGKTYSTDFPMVGAYQSLTNGGLDVFLVQMTADGSDLLYSSYLGGSLEDIGYAVTVDALGAVFVTGSTKSSDFPVKQPFIQGDTFGGGTDAFVSRFDLSATGENSLKYSIFLGGAGDDSGVAIASASPGNCYVVGHTRSGDFPLVGPMQDTITPYYSGYSANAFLAIIADDQDYADLTVTIDDLPDPVEIDSNYTYQVHVANSGSGTATGVVLSNTLPAEVSFVSMAATQGTPVYDSGIVTLDIGTINIAETVTLTITVTAPGTDTTLSNTANVTSTSADSNVTDNSITEETLVRSQFLTFTFYNRNYPDTSEPSCGTITSTPAGIACVGGTCSADFLVDTVLRLTATTPENCYLRSWAGGDGYTDCGDTDDDCLATVFSGAWAKADFQWINADLYLTSEDQPDVSLISGTVEYHLTIATIGTHSASSLVLVDTLPPEAVYISSTTTSGSCSYDSGAHQVTCNISYLADNQQVDVTIAVTAPATPGTMTNQAVVSNSVNDRDLTNNAITEITTITDQQQTLTVTKTGDGTGTVTGSLPGVDCGGDCTELYPQGSLVTLLPAPALGSFFTGWSGDDCSGMDDCVVFLDGDKTVNATFTGTPPVTVALPKTGQTTCFDDAGAVIDCAGTGQDGEIQAGMIWPDPRFEITYCDATGPCSDQSADCDADSSTDTITDLMTGLEWSRSSDITPQSVVWQGALDFIAGINAGTGLGGHSDWRLPNINELVSVAVQHKGGEYSYSWLNSQGFAIPTYYSVWSSSTVEDSYRGNVYTVNLGSGIITVYAKVNILPVWAVRGSNSGPMSVLKTGQTQCFASDGASVDCLGSGQDGEFQTGADKLPQPRFSVIYCDSSGECADQSTDCDADESTDMVRDNLTGLILARDAYLMGSGGSYQATRDALVTLNSGIGLGGHNNWRLPNVLELNSLIDITENNPVLPEAHPFINVKPYNYYWSSTTADLTWCSGGTCANRAYAQSLMNGNGYLQYKTSSYYLWPVRSDTGSADLVLSMTDNADPVQVNGSLIYTIDIFNNGPGDATGVNLENTLPPEVVLISASSSQGSCSHNAGDVTCLMDDIASNATSTVSIEVSPGASPLTVENSAIVTTSNNDPNSENNTASETTRISDTEYLLTVERSGTGTGNVTSNPADIDCGSTCSHIYFETSSITLTATENVSSLFMGWDGCDQVTGNECTVAMGSNRTVTALFDSETTADYYVSSTGDDSNSGLGWSRPFQTIEKALSVAESGEEIWVRAGSYQPPVTSELSKTSYFALYKKVSLYGGFAGNETARAQRDWVENVTTVDAQRSGYSTRGFYINTGSDSGPGIRARIDGFAIRGGWSLGSYYPLDTGGGIVVYSGAPLIANCDIKFNYAVTGGGIAAGYGTTIVNCKVHHNNAQNWGGGIQGNSGIQVINSAVYSNYSTYSGGGIAFWGGGSIDSSTITGNWISSGSSGVAGFHGYSQGTTDITNSIIWGNTKGGNPSEISTSSSGGASANVTYSNIRGGYAGTGNVDNDPGFFDLSGGDLKVQPYAGTIDTGNTAGLPNDSADLDEDGNTSEQLPWDLVANSRVISTVDMGAYEYIPGFYTEHTLTVTVDPSVGATVTGPGVSCGSSCSADYYADSELTLTAVSQSPYRFAYWEGCNSSNWDQCTVTIDAAKTVISHLVDENADVDSDTMLDWWEWFYFHSLTRDGNGDYDGDGLSDKDESAQGTNPDDSDSDGDGMPDGWEVSNTLLPLTDDADLDADSDGLTNLEEYEIGTNPRLEDTDADGMPDAWEDTVGLNPTVNDASGDADGDGISNIDEYINGTNPTPLCGDVSDDTVIDLTDLIMVFQVLTGTSSTSHFNGDCNSDGKIGLNEGLLILQRVADE